MSLAQVTPRDGVGAAGRPLARGGSLVRKRPDEVAWDVGRRIAERALADGKLGRRPHTNVFTVDFSAKCWNPVSRELKAVPPPGITAADRRIQKPMFLDVDYRCRRCPPCLAYRAREWTERAKAEVAAATRTWFGTITLNPEVQFRVLTCARAEMIEQGIDFDRLNVPEQFGLRCAIIGKMLTLYLKRVRKGIPLRFVLVAEAHKSGDPHFHILVHEVFADKPVSKRELQNEWPYGFTTYKLVKDPRVAHYVCKYLSKSAMARVRASQRYGEGAMLILPTISHPSNA